MGRPIRDGLLYFPFDTDFFFADRRIKRLQFKFGNNGLLFYIYLLTEIYRNGYYMIWDDESVEDAMEVLRLKEGFIEQVLIYLRSRSLLTMSTLSAGVPVITSHGIQKRYQEAVKNRKRQFFVDAEIWLLSEDETEACIKVTKNQSISEKNQSNSEKNKGNSEKNATNNNKSYKTIYKDIIVTPDGETGEDKKTAYVPTAFDRKCIDFLIQSILNDFPNQKVPKTDNEISKWAVHINRMRNTDKIDEETIWNTLVWTMQDSFWRTNIRSTSKFREKFQTLYLQSKRSGNKGKNNFNNFQQNNYDFDALEKELLANNKLIGGM